MTQCPEIVTTVQLLMMLAQHMKVLRLLPYLTTSRLLHGFENTMSPFAGGPIHGLIKIATDHRLGIPSQCFAAAKAGIGELSFLYMQCFIHLPQTLLSNLKFCLGGQILCICVKVLTLFSHELLCHLLLDCLCGNHCQNSC